MPLYVCLNLFLVFNAIIYVSRYRVEVMVNYKDESTKFLQWYRECTELIEQLADEVNTLKIEVGVYNFKIKILILGLSLILFVYFPVQGW